MWAAINCCYSDPGPKFDLSFRDRFSVRVSTLQSRVRLLVQVKTFYPPKIKDLQRLNVAPLEESLIQLQ